MQRADLKHARVGHIGRVTACATALALLAILERHWPELGVLVFVLLTLSIGLVHGAGDILLMMQDRKVVFGRNAALYGSCVLLCAAVLSVLGAGVALLALLAMSLWHFGESPQHAPGSSYWPAMQRICLGGASVMLPMILSPQALATTVRPWLGTSTAWVWEVWQVSAWMWLALSLVLVFALIQQSGLRDQPLVRLLGEITAIAVLNAMLSPVLAFALFFGVYHSAGHLFRLLRVQGRASRLPNGTSSRAAYMSWALAVLAVWCMIGVLWTVLPAYPTSANWLAVLVITLASVTLPHMVLIAKHNAQLYQRF